MNVIQINDDALQTRLTKVAAAMQDTTQLGHAIALSLDTVTQDNFDSEGRPKWAGLSPNYAKKRKPGKLLFQTGHLRRSITTSVTSDSVTIGTNVIYAAIHHFGGTIKHPGGTRYVIRDGRAQFVSNGFTGPTAGVTKPHNIDMPPRPYLPMDELGFLQREAEDAVFDDVDFYWHKSFA